MCVTFIAMLGIVGGNEQGTISNADMMKGAGICSGILLLSGFICQKIEERNYLTEEEYKKLIEKERKQ